MSTLQRHQIICVREYVPKGGGAYYKDALDDPRLTMYLPGDVYDDMRQPEYITLTVEPGDTINDEK